jgi:malic enzyme
MTAGDGQDDGRQADHPRARQSEPEIRPEVAKAVRPDCIIATGRSDYPNQVNNVLCFPYIFRGALDCGATKITEAMKLACVREIAGLAKAEASDEVAAAYQGPGAALRPRLHHPDTVRRAPHPAHRARGRRRRRRVGRRDAADRRPRGVPPRPRPASSTRPGW